jgi:GNAT superfamily N-acetyltransferase
MRLIIQIFEWPAGTIEPLVRESESEGFRFVKRLRDEWLSGANCFSNAGEAFFGVNEDGRLLAIGGINQESEDCGRLRRFYVKKDARRNGVGRSLADHIVQFASRHYSRVLLKTDTEAADQFYVSLGFVRLAQNERATHLLDLKKKPNQPLEPTTMLVTDRAAHAPRQAPARLI